MTTAFTAPPLLARAPFRPAARTVPADSYLAPALVRSRFTGAPALQARPAATASPRHGSNKAAVTMRFSGGGSSGFPTPQERVLAMLPYFIPLLDVITYGRFIFRKVPEIATIFLLPLGPVLSIYRGIPFVAFGVFLALYTLVVRNEKVPRFIRWNAQQAILLDIILIVPQLFSSLGGAPIPIAIVETLNNTVFYGMLTAVIYSWFSNAKGELPDQIPGVSDSVNRMGF